MFADDVKYLSRSTHKSFHYGLFLTILLVLKKRFFYPVFAFGKGMSNL